MRSTVASATLVALLFDVAPGGTARIITHAPLTLDELTPGQDRTVTWRLQAAGYDVAADHRLMLVLTSKDPLYSDASVEDSATTLTSDAGTPWCCPWAETGSSSPDPMP
ncbi:CocE/NonD family hydrolase C-terminal non-catalytic domain-containing protein [Streptomyces bambusae]|uniref:CocE/NonD family hydrolase C-terminal non-catalytic domain-containing protein n=1 Tax=Streptomyces bambusae TaxID=1550616 RepID=UPI0027E19D26|nr:CocE/NonD family hydrolase C-terminal non-catalytic domain-containing protein [Streptomyces bambusae]